MELIKRVKYDFVSALSWSLDTCSLPKDLEDRHYNSLMQDKNFSLSNEQQQYYWYRNCFELLSREITNIGKCCVHFDVYLYPSRLSPSNDYKTLVFGSNTYTLFTEVYGNKQYEHLNKYHDKMSATTKFGYAWWLYCFSGQEKEFFEHESYNHHKDCVIEITIENLC